MLIFIQSSLLQILLELLNLLIQFLYSSGLCFRGILALLHLFQFLLQLFDLPADMIRSARPAAAFRTHRLRGSRLLPD
ncbi:hypothetical protein D3C76_1182170 [compost metagenome]